jgi:hypothetical protein
MNFSSLFLAIQLDSIVTSRAKPERKNETLPIVIKKEKYSISLS